MNDEGRPPGAPRPVQLSGSDGSGALGRWAPWGEPTADPRRRVPAVMVRLELEGDEALVWLESESAEDELALVRWILSKPRAVVELADDLAEILSELDDFPAAA